MPRAIRAWTCACRWLWAVRRLPTADSRLPTADSRLPTADGRLPTADRRLPTADCRLPMADGRLPTADGRWPTADGRLPTADCRPLSLALSFALLLVVGSGCYLFHDYDVCEFDSDCSATRECIDGLCQTKAEYTTCGSDLPDCPSGTTCDESEAVCVPSDAGDAGGEDTGDTGDAGIDSGDVSDASDATADQDLEPIECGEQTACNSGSCDGFFECVAGCCQALTTCIEADQPCTTVDFDSVNVACDLETGLCGDRCDTEDTFGCRRGRLCVASGTPTDEFDGVCRLGDCNDACFDPDDCVGSTPFTCDFGDERGTCVAFSRESSFCLEAGETEAGGSCEADAVDTLECVPGALCFNGQCVEPCAYDGADPAAGCFGDPVCVPVFDAAGENQSGVCGQGCSPFSEGECPSNEKCAFAVGLMSGELTAWICVPEVKNNEGDSIPTVGLGEDCDASADPANTCEEGTFCDPGTLEPEQGACVQYCDPLGVAGGGLANCVPLPGGPLLGDSVGATALGDASDYRTIDAGVEAIDVWEVPEETDETLVAANESAGLEAGIAYSILAFPSNPGYSAEIIHDWGPTTIGPVTEPGLVFYNTTQDTVDLFEVDTVPNVLLAPGGVNPPMVIGLAGRELGLGFSAGVTLGPDSETPAFGWVDPEDLPAAGGAIWVVAIGQDDPVPADPTRTVELKTYDLAVPELGDYTVAVRMVHASVATPNLSVNWPGEDYDQNVLRYGEVTDEWWVGEYDSNATVEVELTLIWGAEAGDRLSDTFTFQPPGAFTIVLADLSPESVRYIGISEVEPIAEEGVSWIGANASHHDLLELRPEIATFVASERRQPLDGAFEMAEGLHYVRARRSADVRGEDADSRADSLAEGMLDLPSASGDASILSLVLSQAEGDGDSLSLTTIIHPPPTLPSSDSGSAVVRLINSADGVDLALSRSRIEFSCVESEVELIGLCIAD